MNKIEIKLEKRPDTRHYIDNEQLKRFENKFMHFADITIDGNSLYQEFKQYDFISTLGWGTEESQNAV